MTGDEYKENWIESVERLKAACDNNPNEFPCSKIDQRLRNGSKKPCIVITGGAGFIGSHVAEKLLQRGDRVAIIDDVNGKDVNKLWNAAYTPWLGLF